MREIGIFSDNHTPGDGELPTLGVMDSHGRILPADHTPIYRTFESEHDGSFRVQIGKPYSIEYSEDALKTVSGRVRRVTGTAEVDDEGHLLLTDAVITFTETYDKEKPVSSVFMAGYIRGMRVIEDTNIIFEFRKTRRPYIPRNISVGERVSV